LKHFPNALIVDKASVAPCAGAWIETPLHVHEPGLSVSPPARGRGLKLAVPHNHIIASGRPLRGGVD